MTTRHHDHEPTRRRLRARLARLSPARALPEETARHLRNAGREQLLAVRSLLDAVIARLERTDERS